MVEDNNVDFDAFIEFSDLGLEDYIHNLDWDIKGWTDASMVARARFYFDLLKHDLTSY